jgi:hypothetical protein
MAGKGWHKTTNLLKKGDTQVPPFSPDYMQMIMAVPVCAGSVNAVLVKGFSC